MEFKRIKKASKFSLIWKISFLSKDKTEVKELVIKGQIVEKLQDIIKDPYILEFLGLDEKDNYSENRLETEIIDLKIGEVTHQDLGQMQMYLNYYDRHVKVPD